MARRSAIARIGPVVTATFVALLSTLCPAALAQPSAIDGASARAVLAKVPPPESDRAASFAYWLERERAAFTVGSGRLRLEALRKLVEFAPDESTKLRWTGYLWREEWRHNNQTESLRIGEALAENPALPALARVPNHGILYHDYMSIGRRDKAAASLARAEELLAQSAGTGDAVAQAYAGAVIGQARGHDAGTRGDSWSADRHYRDALRHAQEQLALTRGQAAASRASQFDRAIRTKDSVLSGLVSQYIRDGRLADAEALAKVALAFAEGEGKSGSLQDSWLTRIGQVKLAARDFDAAADVLGQALEKQRANGLAPGSDGVVKATLARIEALVGGGRWADALRQYEDILAAAKDDAVARGRIASAPLAALLMAMNGRGEEARRTIEPSLSYRERNYGPNHPLTIESLAVRSIVDFQRDFLMDSLRDAERVHAWLAAPQNAPGDLVPKGLRGVYVPMALRRMLAIAASEWKGGDGQLDEGLFDRSFQAADYLRSREVQEAVADSALRAFADDPAIGPLIRREQDLRNAGRKQVAELVALVDKERAAKGAEAKEKAAQLVKAKRGEVAQTQSQREALQLELAERFPAYASLVNPRPPKASEVASSLREAEALLSVYVNEDGAYAWAVDRQGRRAFHFSPKAQGEIDRAVAGLRGTLDLGEMDPMRPRSFDYASSAALYGLLVRPLEGVLGSARTVFVATGGRLATIPPAVLVRAVPGANADPAAAVWWIRSQALASLPSASSLVSLRSMRRTATARPFFGVGDPRFGPAATAAPSAVRKLAGGVRGPGSDVVIPPLPETREEILALARSLKADPARDTLLGEAATRPNVMAADLSDRRIVAFATHGLRAGELPGLGQPALALATTPDSAPFLVLDDVLKLRLNADVVVLSACNTAASDGRSAEALSGLGRGFLFAGSRALLVTHWAVESDSAQKLMVSTFAPESGDAGAVGQRLRGAQIGMLEGKWGKPFTHPAFWAPYALAGDPGP